MKDKGARRSPSLGEVTRAELSVPRTGPNSRSPYNVAMTVHFKNAGVPILMLLDIVEVAHSHSSFNLAAVFAKISEDFGISDKISRFHRRENV